MSNPAGAHHNPLDRNHDGKVNLQDLKPHAGAQAGVNANTNTTTGAHHNPLDRNHDGRVDARDLTGNQTGAHHNPLDRNHDGRVDARDLSGNQGAYVQGQQRASLGLVRAEPTVIETIQKDVVVHERIHPVQKEEIQPVIYREREQLDVKQVTQLLHETQIQPTLVQQRELPAERREAIVERAAPIAENYVAPSREVDATLRSQVVHAPIVNEVIKKTVIEEIQPVLERDIIQSTVIQNTQPIYEKFVEAPTVYRETRVVQDRGVVGGDLEALRAQGFNVGQFGLGGGVGTTGQVGLGGVGNQYGQTGLVGNQYGQTGLVGNQTGHHNPLDRNHDGRVDARDLTGNQTGAHHNPLDRNHDGRVDARDLSGNQGTTGLHGETLNTHHGLVGSGQTGLVGNQTGVGASAHHNPLDRNHDGRVDLKDVTGRPATNANTSVGI